VPVPNPFARQQPSLWPGGILEAVAQGTPPLVFDATVSEQHGEQYALASSPIEGGAQVTDHVQRQPVGLTVDVVLSDTPDDLVTYTPDRAQGLYADILAVARTRVPFDYNAPGVGFYPSMAFTSIGLPRSAETGGTWQVTLVMRQIEIATVDQAAVLADAALAIALGRQNLGSIQPEVTQALDALGQPAVV